MLTKLSNNRINFRPGQINLIRKCSTQSKNNKKELTTTPGGVTNLLTVGKFSGRCNVVINFLPSGYHYVIERFGKFVRVEQPGLSVMLPIINKIAYVVDMRELCIRISPEEATTNDNVKVKLGGNLFVQFYDAQKAAYGATFPIYAVTQFAQAAMRTAVGSHSLDRLFVERAKLNSDVKTALEIGATEDDDPTFPGVHKWGCKVIRFEITELNPVDKHVDESLHKQSTAERERREKIITAEANKKEIELSADAYKYKQIEEAKGDAERKMIAADADAYAIKTKAQAEKESIQLVSDALGTKYGVNAMSAQLSKHYFESLKSLGGKSTIIIPQELSNIASMISVGSTVFKNNERNNA